MREPENTLDAELLMSRRSIATDGYSVSIGELTSMYRDGDLVIRPAYQRLFRWDNEQKSRFIESILLGIPLPSVFVAQDDLGRWEVIDGLQRISTLLQLQGVLEPKNEVPELILSGTKFLPSLEGKRWDSENEKDQLTISQKRDIKRSKFDLKIIKRQSDHYAKYELFQRLNSFGTALSSQEIRDAMLGGINERAVEWIHSLASDENFAALIRLPEKDIASRYDEELVLRFLWLHQLPDEGANKLFRFQEQLEDFSIRLAENFPEDSDQLENTFRNTFSLLAGSPDVFRRWNASKRRFQGGFLNTSFEVIALGLANRLYKGEPHRSDFEQAARELWVQPDMAANVATGRSTERRLQLMLPKGRALMGPVVQ